VGCPILGDEKYGARTDPAHRLALHSTALRFTHPVTGEELAFASPLPKELVAVAPPPAFPKGEGRDPASGR
jgi:23S rRNA pseudouridine1911/1915/1917 synthase